MKIELTDNEIADLAGMKIQSASDKNRIVDSIEDYLEGVANFLEPPSGDNIIRALTGSIRIASIYQEVRANAHTIGMIAVKAFLTERIPSVDWSKVESTHSAHRNGPDLHIPEHKIVVELKTSRRTRRIRKNGSVYFDNSNLKKASLQT